MRRALLAVVAAAAVCAGLAAGGGGAASTQPLAAFSMAGRTPVLIQVDPLTFRRVGKREVDPDGFWSGSTVSPTRPLAVFGNHHRQLLFLDTARLRKLGTMKLYGPGDIRASAWFGDRVVLVTAPDAEPLYVRTVDAVKRRLLAARRLAGTIQATARTPEALVLLLAGEGIGPTTLAVVPPAGAIRTVVLEQIRSGWDVEEDFEVQKVRPFSTAALAADPAGRAFVTAGGMPVAEVDLATLAVSYHALPTPPAGDAAAKGGGVDGPARQAVWLGDGVFALTGTDSHGWIDTEGRAQTRTNPAGAILVDTRSWTAKVLDPAASYVSLAGSTLLVESSTWDSASGVTTAGGLTAYGPDGSKRYRFFDGTNVFVQAVGSRLILQPTRPRFRYSVVETATGRVVRSVQGTDPPWVLVPDAG